MLPAFDEAVDSEEVWEASALAGVVEAGEPTEIVVAFPLMVVSMSPTVGVDALVLVVEAAATQTCQFF